MPLRECMQKTTHREYILWQKYLDDDWSIPSRSDHYLMQVAQRVYQLMLVTLKQNPSKVTLESQKVPFTTAVAETTAKKPKVTKAQREQAASFAKTRWLAGVGFSRKKKDG